ncbi:hypothetical protein WJ976_13125 [Achromobacter denitrificans]
MRHWRARRPDTGRQTLLPRLGILLYSLLVPVAALAYAPGTAYEDINLGLTAGVAAACALACTVCWAATRNAIHGAGLAFMLIEGVLRATPSCFPPRRCKPAPWAPCSRSPFPSCRARPPPPGWRPPAVGAASRWPSPRPWP